MKFHLTSIFVLTLLTATAQNWPEFRGPTGQGISSATNIPVTWSSTNHIAWKRPIPGKGWSSPVSEAGKIYLTSAVPKEGSGIVSLRVLCLDATDGRIIWNVEAVEPEGSALKAMHSKNSPASPTPIVSGGKIFAHFGHLGTASLDLNGKVLWQQKEIKYAPVHGNGGSPVLVDGLLVFSCDSAENPTLAALDAISGKLRWRTARKTTARNKFSFSTPLVAEVDGKKQIISPASGLVAGYNPSDGTEIWRYRYGNGYSIVPRPVIAHGLIFVSSGFDNAVLHAFKTEDLKGDITGSHVAWTHSRGVPTTPSMLVVKDEIYFVSDSGVASCLDAKKGTVHWSERLGGGFSASPIFADGRIYFLNEEGITYVIKPDKKFELLAKNELGERSLASFAVTGNALLIRTEKHLWSVQN